jgi:Family of unknown function (DUF5681)
MSNPNLIEATKAHRFQPGRSGNPKGRPPRRSLIEILKAELAKIDGPHGETNGEQMIHRLVQHAIHGNIRAAQLVLEYAEGKPEQPVRMVEDQIKRGAVELNLDPKVVLLRTREMAERLA